MKKKIGVLMVIATMLTVSMFTAFAGEKKDVVKTVESILKRYPTEKVTPEIQGIPIGSKRISDHHILVMASVNDSRYRISLYQVDNEDNVLSDTTVVIDKETYNDIMIQLNMK